MRGRVNCKICNTPNALSGTRLCDDCWSALRYSDPMLFNLGVDIEIRVYREHTEYRWSVDLMADDVTYGHTASTLEEALAGAAERMRAGG